MSAAVAGTTIKAIRPTASYTNPRDVTCAVRKQDEGRYQGNG